MQQTLTQAKQLRLSYQGPVVAVHLENRGKTNFMPRVGNSAHVFESNNGYARKQSGGFYMH